MSLIGHSVTSDAVFIATRPFQKLAFGGLRALKATEDQNSIFPSPLDPSAPVGPGGATGPWVLWANPVIYMVEQGMEREGVAEALQAATLEDYKVGRAMEQCPIRVSYST